VSIAALRPVRRPARLRGELHLPSDKSVAHRALIANALAGGPATVRVHEPGDDVRSTVHCLRELGVEVAERNARGSVELELRGSPRQPARELDCGNSGTTMRLLAGALAGLPIEATLHGDASLRRRPMERVAKPLREMGAGVETTNGLPPLRITGRERLLALEHRLPVASAQLVAAISLAALAAEGETQVVAPAAVRDHTERLLAAMGASIHRQGTTTVVRGPATLHPLSLKVPGDSSGATPWLVAAAIHPDADLRLADVGLNPSRLAAVEVLREMGAEIRVRPSRKGGPEPMGEIRVRSGQRLRSVTLGGDRVAALIDELPALAVAMAAADGTSEVHDAGELRVKESDRIAAVTAGLAAIGANVEALPDGWRVSRGSPHDAAITTYGDHRIAMAFAIAALAGVAGEVAVDDPECASVSYPTFWDDVERVSGGQA
jgi:3-phosphoshikimate 1-carboxyvinyltransferase